MLTPVPVAPRYTHAVDIFSIPEEHHDAIRVFGMENSYDCFDYEDGDYYVLLRFDVLTLDQTPDDILQKFLDADDEEKMSDEEAQAFAKDKYPYQMWSEELPSLPDYIGWLRALRYIHAHLPPEFQASKTLTVHVWH